MGEREGEGGGHTDKMGQSGQDAVDGVLIDPLSSLRPIPLVRVPLAALAGRQQQRPRRPQRLCRHWPLLRQARATDFVLRGGRGRGRDAAGGPRERDDAL
eukprot:6172256-Pleurochrysis_carterae.AAC.8